MMKQRLIVAGFLYLVGPGSALAEETPALPSMLVEAQSPMDPSTASVSADDIRSGLPADGGEWLREITGMAGSRLGGHGMEPVLRGQSQNRINVLLDGAYVYGGCPNRMDPPSSYAAPATYDKVTVLKGAEGLIYGAGASAGTVLFERDTPRFEEGERLRGRIGLGYQSNADTEAASADVTAGGRQGYLRLFGDYQDADNYEDGDGNEVRSAYTTSTAGALMGYTPDDDTRLELGLEATRGRDILYEGAGMDSPEESNDLLRLKFDRENLGGPLSALRVELYHSDVFHVMDNFSLRTPPANPAMWMEVPSDSLTHGGRLVTDLARSGDAQWTVGFDYRDNNREAIRYSGASLDLINSYMWPDVTIAESGLFAKMVHDFSQANHLSAALRYDRISADADKADAATTAPMTLNPDALYTTYYGTTAGRQTENNISGLLRLEHDLEGKAAIVFASLSRTVRTADATERFMAANAMASDRRWIGNPGLEPEAHQQVELGTGWRGARWDTTASVYYDRVSDYILRDRAHGQEGILETDNANIYRNVDAELYGAELDTRLSVAAHWSSRMALAYVRATNTSDDRPIAQTPPLEGNISLDYQTKSLQLGAKVRAAASQTRVDDDPNTGSGLDLGSSDSFMTLDLYGAYQPLKRVEIGFGVNNVFDRTYAEHLNRFNPMDPTPVKVNEPGRSYWIKAGMTF